ncbi:MAG: hypothetical protein QM764_03015 [Chitinophagaceae bacterium]
MRINYCTLKMMIGLILLSGCMLPHSEGIDKIWFFTYYNGKTTGTDSVLTPASFINLQSNGFYTSDLDEYEYGKWKREDKTLYLASYNNKVSTIKLEYFAGNEMRISSEHMPAASFEAQLARFKNDSENPFAGENNLWRLHAAQKEKDVEIRDRLLNHMRFWELYFRWALNSDITSIDVRSTPTPVKIYGNGFALKAFEDLPAKWKSYFYDEEDCRKASEMIKSVFEKKNIAWAHTENKYKFFISAFQQLQQQLK